MVSVSVFLFARCYEDNRMMQYKLKFVSAYYQLSIEPRTKASNNCRSRDIGITGSAVIGLRCCGFPAILCSYCILDHYCNVLSVGEAIIKINFPQY